MAKGKKKRGSPKGIVTCPFRYFNTLNLTAGTVVLQFNPGFLGTSIVSVSDGYSLFRIKKLKFRILALTTAASAAFLPSVPNTLPATNATNMEGVASIFHAGPVETVFSPWVSVPAAVFSGPLPWYHTRPGTFDVTEVYPCVLNILGTGTNSLYVDIEGTFQFKDPLTTNSTPMIDQLRRQIRDEEARILLEKERNRLLKILGGTIAKP